MRANSAGTHVVIDGYVKDVGVFSRQNLEGLFLNLAKRLGMTILLGPQFVDVPLEPDKLAESQRTGEFSGEGGITGFCIISTSHMSIHCWPLQRFFSLDLFSCKDFDPEPVIEQILTLFATTSEEIAVIERKKPVFKPIAPLVKKLDATA